MARWPSTRPCLTCLTHLQNAGKSSLINAMRQAARLPKDNDVTTAPLPGTTLGEHAGMPQRAAEPCAPPVWLPTWLPA